MDKEILEILKRLENKVDNLEKGQQKLEEGQKRIEKKIDIRYDQVARTAEDITSIKSDLNTVETITAKNWQDITKLKSIK